MDSEFDDTELLAYTDAQIIEYIASLPSLPGERNIIPLSSKYVAKGYFNDRLIDAAESLELASKLGIRVPCIRRTVRDNDDTYCIMDWIPGKPLDILWPKLGWLATLQLAFQLRRIVYRLRSVESASSGSLATGKCRSFYLEDSFRLPFRSSSYQVNAFLNFWANFISIRHEIKKTQVEHSICPKSIFLSNCPFVFTHHDLAPRNIILDNEGYLWLIDWDLAGFYPKFFEYASMHNFNPTGWSKSAVWRWKFFTWIAGGLYDKEYKWLATIRSKFRHFPPARRFNMKANGYAAAAGRPDKDNE